MNPALIAAGAALLLTVCNGGVNAKTTDLGSNRSIGASIDGGSVLAQRGRGGGGAARGGGGSFRGGGGVARSFSGGGGRAFTRGGGGTRAFTRGGAGRAFTAPRGGGGRVVLRGRTGGGAALVPRGGVSRFAVGPRRGIRRGRHIVRRAAPLVVFGAAPFFYDYGYSYYYDDPCYEVRQVWTQYGWRYVRVYVCD